jgi:hypothetical protein
MTVASNMLEVAENHRALVYAFYRVCKLHKISTGKAEDFGALPKLLDEQESFRTDFFRLLASMKSSDQDLSQDNVVAIVALAMGGSDVAQLSSLEVDDRTVDLLTAAWTGRPHIAAPHASTAELPEAQVHHNSAPQSPTLRAAEPNTLRPQASDHQPEVTQAPFRIVRPAGTFTIEKPPETPANLSEQDGRESSPQQGTTSGAVRNDLPDAGLSEELKRLEANRIALELRIEQLEQRLAGPASSMPTVDHPIQTDAVPRLSTVPNREPQHDLREELPPNRRPLAPVSRTKPEHTPDTHQRTGLAPSRGGHARNEEAPVGTKDRAETASFLERLRGIDRRLLVLFALLVVVAIFGTRLYLGRSSPAQNTTAPDPPYVADDNPASGTSQIPSKAASESSPAGSGGQEAGVESEVTSTISRWAAAASHNDVEAETSFYAPKLDRYFLQRNVSREYVRKDKRAYRDRGNVIKTFKVSDLNFERSSDQDAIVLLSKSWSVLGPSQTGDLHTGRSRLWLRRTPEGWRITGEQDLKPSAAVR